ncbi:MAG: hypothetical protein FJX60_08625 [Alphaproteobacteria bacterium]|nr:hypothetical protein [Alphaproteobacteria bacterium]
MAADLVDFDAKESKVVVTSPEFSGIAANTARRRPPTAGAPGLEYLVFADSVRVAVVNHQWSETPVSWPEIDLVQYIGTVNPGGTLEKKIGASAPYARGGAIGRLTQFSAHEGNEGVTCVAYGIKAVRNRVTGFICLPGTAPMTEDEARRLVNSVGVIGALPPA